ncbi:MAG: hypothetical protein ACXVI6_04835 [Candidatus Aminicenantales bacterium]
MMKKTCGFGLLGLAVLLALDMPLAGYQGITIQRDVTVAAGETQDNVFTLGGNAVIAGKVRRSVIAIGGTITVSGEVGEAVVGFGSRVVIKESAVINGDVVTLGGTLEKETGCTIRGDTVYLQGPEIGQKILRGDVFKGLLLFPLLPIIIIVKLVILFIWLILALVGAALFPKQIAFASGQIRKSFWPTFAVGLLAIIIFTGLILFAALLSIILIGIPVLMALVAAGIIIKIFGRLAVFYFFGDSVRRAFGSQRVSDMGAVLLGLLVVGLIGFLPIIGFLFSIPLNIMIWGVAIRTKFGTTENMFQKKQAVLPAPPAAPAV